MPDMWLHHGCSSSGQPSPATCDPTEHHDKLIMWWPRAWPDRCRWTRQGQTDGHVGCRCQRHLTSRVQPCLFFSAGLGSPAYIDINMHRHTHSLSLRLALHMYAGRARIYPITGHWFRLAASSRTRLRGPVIRACVCRWATRMAETKREDEERETHTPPLPQTYTHSHK
jgi:hypothetical protein